MRNKLNYVENWEVYRGMTVNNGIWYVLAVMYCLSTDTLIDLYIMACCQVACKDTFSYSEEINTFWAYGGCRCHCSKNEVFH